VRRFHIRLRRFAKRVGDRVELERDYWRLRIRHGRAIGGGTNDGQRIALLVSLNQFVYQLKLEAMMMKALQLKGLTPVALIPAGARSPRRYLNVFGITRFVELPDYVTPAFEAEARREAEKILARDLSVADLAALTFHGAAVGRFVLSSVSRALHEGRVDLSDPAARKLLEELLPVALRSTLAAEAILDDLNPELLLFIERNYAAEAPLSDLALERGINVVQFVSSSQDDAYVFKRYTAETRRIHPRSLDDESWKRVRALPWGPEQEAELDEELRLRYDNANQLARRRQEWTRTWDADELRRELGLDPAKKTAVIYSHILWDANMFYGDDLFEDQEEWFVATVRAACANPNANWVVKLHPDNVWKRKRDNLESELGDVVVIRERIGELPQHVSLLRPESPISTRSLFDVTDCGVTIRGSVGIELPCLGIPVLTAGTGFYSGRGFTVDSATREEYLERLAHIEDVAPLTPEQVELARRHAHALFRLRPLRFDSFGTVIRPLSGIGHQFDHNLVLRLRTRADLERADDLRRLGDWAVDSRELDYLSLTSPG
jgi:hypothetical protein